jgi:hypothetical protein
LRRRDPDPDPDPEPDPDPDADTHANPDPDPDSHAGRHANPDPDPGATPVKVAAFSAKVTPAHPCGTISVQAKVLHPVRGTTFSASATATFINGGAVTVPKRVGKSFVAVGKIKVPAGEPAHTRRRRHHDHLR